MIEILLLVLLGVGLWLLYTRNPGLGRETLRRILDVVKWIGQTHILNPLKGFLK